MKTYRIHAALYTDNRSGDIWCYEKLNSRLVKIKYQNKSVIVSRRFIDKNFMNLYNQTGYKRWFVSPQKNSLVIDSYYREKLGIEETAKDYDLTIKRVGKYDIFNHLRYLQDIPMTV